MSINYRINNKLEIFSQDNKKIGDSMLQGENSRNLYISAPIGREGIRFLYLGDKIRVLYYGDENKVYEFYTEVTERAKDRIVLFGIRKPEKYSIVQRRQSVRIPIALNASYAIMKNERYAKGELPDVDTLKNEFKEIMEECRTYDLSAGGIGVYLPKTINAGDWLVFFLEEEEMRIAAIGQVVRIGDENKTDKKLRSMGVRFANGTMRYEDQLFHFIFKKMREQIQLKEKEKEELRQKGI